LLVIADGKRGDVPHTALAYGQALMGSTPSPWGDVPGLGADAVTANPLLGRDALAPIVDAARAADGAVFVLVRTSNPGAGELQDDAPGGCEPLHMRLAALVRELGDEGPRSQGLVDVGAVVAATEPELLGTLREAMPHSIFLLPGVGAQGGRVELLAPAFAPGPAAALVAASRTIVDAALDAGDPEAARYAAERLRADTWRAAAAAR
jgi:orotidine-5'-phosphate decarboxylase